MGLMQRTKGKVFERAIAAQVRERWPGVIVRRASQAERADNPDVFAEGHSVLDRLWLELQDAKAPTPIAKLEQAERDVEAFHGKRVSGSPRRVPVVVWHKLASRTIWVTARLWVINNLAGWVSGPKASAVGRQVVTLELDDFLDLVDGCATAGGLTCS